MAPRLAALIDVAPDDARRALHALSEPEAMSAVLPGMRVHPALGSDCARVRRVVAALQEDQRTVLELAYFEGLSLVEIGERLAVPVGTVKSRLSRALDKLRTTLQEQPRAAAG
ncbi:sigma-70 family RNA polymerase sigma factor [Sorangium atrum]|uniref:Sigma-70 family RNA polymerase sigma factor n=1 Tax=Sorangium atrum TaxID=2995308 RepID=A0ABT5CEA9_9BACT|nr:sigma-70 family RNA polymerase sigma factor [Sorangium aterium]MDC0684780.1 sigma-70 family RNA polymerase sigma factor [Sorangium aterium]MDC0685532.1 sigma-70 family RNA polymerase sigma factor [Sorangium aterium]